MNLDHCKDTLNLALTIKKKKCTAKFTIELDKLYCKFSNELMG